MKRRTRRRWGGIEIEIERENEREENKIKKKKKPKTKTKITVGRSIAKLVRTPCRFTLAKRLFFFCFFLDLAAS